MREDKTTEMSKEIKVWKNENLSVRADIFILIKCQNQQEEKEPKTLLRF